ncbi:MAG: hypothetical protein H0X38_00930 [Planctomycetes bacterium]|nr:hypothetical protein [Planctomycetota bacterium]
MMDHKIFMESFNVVKSYISESKFLPAQTSRHIDADAELVPVHDVVDAIALGDMPPANSNLDNPWNSFQQNLWADYLSLHYEIMNNAQMDEFLPLQSLITAPILESNQDGSVRSRIRTRLHEVVLFHAGISVTREMLLAMGSGDRDPHPHYSVSLKTCYDLGGWPCGWDGQFPLGRSFIYWPYDEDGRWAQGEPGTIE